MKKQTVSILLLSLSALVFQAEVKAQAFDSNKWEGFFDQEKFQMNFENKTADLLKNAVYLKPEQAATDLVAAEGKKVKIDLPKARKKDLKPTAIADLLKESFVSFAVAYDCGNCHRTHVNSSSGYVISEDGHIVTNYHVVEGFTQKDRNKYLTMSVQGNDGEVYLVNEIVASNQAADLAIVKVDTKGKKLKPLALGNTAKVGEEVFVLSNPAPMINYFTTGKVARNYLSPSNKRNRLPQTDITADYAAGSSGAPIVDRFGNLVCTVSATNSIYYNPQEQKNLQMVAKNTIPVILLKEMIL